MIGKTALGIIAIIVVAVLMFGYVIPYGIEGSEPTATVQVFIQDVTESWKILTASVGIGQPSNTLAFKQPDIQFRPLQTFEQTLTVEATHQYVIWLDVTFDYVGERIATYEQVIVTVIAMSGGNMLLNSQMLSEAGAGARGGNNNTLIISSGLPVGTPPFEYGMSPSDPYIGANSVVSKTAGAYHVIFGADQEAVYEPGFAWLPDKLVSPAGIGIEGIQIDCTVTIYGTANDGTKVIGTVTATLVLHADIGASEPSGGGISVTITDMGAGIREGAW